MASSPTETRLEVHRRGFDRDGYRGPLLRLEDLTPTELILVNSSFTESCRLLAVADLDAIYRAYITTLHLWGVMCPHPQPHRRYDGWRYIDVPVEFTEARWFSCELCHAAVINR